MFLKNKKVFFCFFLIIFFLFSQKVYSDTNNKLVLINYLKSLENFSATFLQNDGESLSEGKVFIGKKRVRAEYLTPVKILIILDENKAMYYNYELEEDEFFNPQNTSAWYFYEVFQNPDFLKNSPIFVILASPRAVTVLLLSCSIVIDLNLISVNNFPSFPTLFWEKNTGPEELVFIAIDNNTKNGNKNNKPINEEKKSKVLLTIYIRFLIAL